MKTPHGFSFSGLNAGIKPARKDLALVVSDAPCAAAGCFTANKAKAAPVADAEARLPAAGVRAVIVNSGNANALTGAQGIEDVHVVHRAHPKRTLGFFQPYATETPSSLETRIRSCRPVASGSQ